jgi:hypothetical protein
LVFAQRQRCQTFAAVPIASGPTTDAGPDSVCVGFGHFARATVRKSVRLSKSAWRVLGGHMRRREFITITGGAALTWPLAARAEAPPKRPVIAWLTMFTAPKPPPTFIQDFLQGLEERGYIKGQNFDFVFRSADSHQDRVPAIVEEFVRLRTDVILAGATFEAVVAKKATSTIPIVCPALADAVHLGLVESESRPGGNLTGIEPYVTGLPGKQIELARELMRRSSPRLTRRISEPIAVVGQPKNRCCAGACRAVNATRTRRRGDRMMMLFAAVHESVVGTKRTCQGGLTMSVDRGGPEVTGSRSNWRAKALKIGRASVYRARPEVRTSGGGMRKDEFP